MTENTYLEIKTSTWHEDKNGLYNYDASLTIKDNFTINHSAVLHRANNSCILNSSRWNKKLSEDSNPILCIKARGGEFIIQQSGDQPNDRLWLVVKSIQSNWIRGYKICEGDWIRMGLLRLRVKKICLDVKKTPENEIPIMIDEEKPKFQYFEPFRGDNNEIFACRICLSNANSIEDPLISPCCCAGTVRNIHISCLQEWLKNKVVVKKSQKATSYFWNKLSCEICQAPLPSSIYIKKTCFHLIKIENPQKPYILLEDYRPGVAESRCLYVVSLNNGEYAYIGRGKRRDIQISEPSISRRHCKLKFFNNSFILEDRKSKFGTLVLMKKAFVLQSHTEVTVQIGRTIVHLLTKEPFSYNSCLWAFGFQKAMPITYCSYLTQSDIIEDSPTAFELPINSSEEQKIEDFESEKDVFSQESSLRESEDEEEKSNEKIIN